MEVSFSLVHKGIFWTHFCKGVQLIRYSGFRWGMVYIEQYTRSPIYKTRVADQLHPIAKKDDLEAFSGIILNGKLIIRTPDLRI